MEVLVLTTDAGPTTDAGHQLVIARDNDGQDFLAVDGERLGQVVSDCMPFFAGGQVIFAGVEREGAKYVTVEGIGTVPVVDGVWMTFPRPFTPGMRVVVRWQDAPNGPALRTYRTPPLERRDLQPHPGAAWTAYAPG